MKKPISRGAAGVLAVVQHLFLAACMVCAHLVSAGQTVVLPGAEGDRTYALWESDRTRTYENSVLFNNIFANNLSTVAAYVAVCSQLETNGVYDGEKTVDATAYVNRGTTLADDYITARYTASNLLKWAQNGFSYETRQMTAGQSAQFLARETTWTHIINNSVSGGMNGYLNAQIEGNIELRTGDAAGTPSEDDIREGYVFYDDPYGSTETEEHTVLINRYRTVDGKNIEDIVSNWSDYQALSSNVVETARSLWQNYQNYLNWKDYYAEENSAMRYYIVRSLGGRQEVYTNVASLAGGASAEGISAYFDGLTKSLYYCPYDLTYTSGFALDEGAVRGMFGGAYSAFYPDQIRVWAGVDLATEGLADDFAAGREQSQRYLPTSQAVRLMAALFAVAWFLALVFRMLLAGHVFPRAEIAEAKRGQLRFYPFDSWATEVTVLLTALLPAAVYIGAEFTAQRLFAGASWRSNPGSVGASAFDAARLFGASALLTCGVLSLIRKHKAGRLATDSLLRRLAAGIARMARFTVAHANLAVSTWVPYAAFVLANVLTTAILFYQRSAFRVPAMVFLAAFDLAVGFALYQTRMRRREIIEGIERVSAGERDVTFQTDDLRGENRRLAHAAGAIGAGIEQAVNTSMQDERLKTELITNVSHDIKTPLTSIINYVGLLKRERIDNEKAQDYIRVLEEKSGQLKRLAEDLVEASKISSGSIEITPVRIDFVEFIRQTLGEFSEKFEEAKLTPVLRAPKEKVFIEADSHHLWRIMENLMGNAAKYSLPNTRVYLDLTLTDRDDAGKRDAVFSIRNVSKSELAVDPKELTERFIRGDEARTSEGSGLGLSIAESLTKAQGGEMRIDVDGDLFKVTIWLEQVI